MKSFKVIALLIPVFWNSFAEGSTRTEIEEEIGSVPWVGTMIKKYPEISWLLQSDKRATQEGKSVEKPDSWSVQVSGIFALEFERTILSLVCLHLIHNGSQEAYEKFTSVQNKDGKLTRENFQTLHEMCLRVISPDSKVYFETLEASLVLGDVGKTEKAHQDAKPYGVTQADHDLFLDECLEACPTIFPTFLRLQEEHPNMVALLQKVTGKVHFGHVTHLEGTPNSMLLKLKKSGVLLEKGNLFDFEIMSHICDVAAAAGHVKKNGSLVMTQNTFDAIMAVREAISTLKTGSPKQAVEKYLQERARLLDMDLETQMSRSLVRLACMLRLFSPEDGGRLVAAAEELESPAQKALAASFDPFQEVTGVTPTYVPAVFVNVYSAIKNKDAAMNKILRDILPFVLRVQNEYRDSKTFDPSVTLSFNDVAGFVKSDPLALTSDTPYYINIDGTVIVKK